MIASVATIESGKEDTTTTPYPCDTHKSKVIDDTAHCDDGIASGGEIGEVDVDDIQRFAREYYAIVGVEEAPARMYEMRISREHYFWEEFTFRRWEERG